MKVRSIETSYQVLGFFEFRNYRAVVVANTALGLADPVLGSGTH